MACLDFDSSLDFGVMHGEKGEGKKIGPLSARTSKKSRPSGARTSLPEDATLTRIPRTQPKQLPLQSSLSRTVARAPPERSCWLRQSHLAI